MDQNPVSPIQLTDEQIDQIAEKAAEKAVAKMSAYVYQEVGKTVISKFIWVVGACSVGVIGWLKGKGVL